MPVVDDPAAGASSNYATLAELKAWIRDDAATDEAQLEFALNAASRAIDQHCRRRFYLDAAASARVYRATDSYELKVHDFYTTSGLIVKTDENDDATFERTWAAADYELSPYSAINSAGEAWPYGTIIAVKNYCWPTSGRRSAVEITAKWGWASVPHSVKHACLILAARLHRRRDTPEGIAGFGEFGVLRIRPEDGDVVNLLAAYRDRIE